MIRKWACLLYTSSLALGVLLSGVVGIIMGDGFMEGILFIGVPMTSGGMTAGTVPLSVIYGDVLGGDAGAVSYTHLDVYKRQGYTRATMA